MSFPSLKMTAISAADLFTVTDGSLLQLLVLPGNMIEFEKVLIHTYDIFSAILVLLSDSKLPSVLKIAAGGLDWNAGTEGVQSIAVYNIYVFDGYNSTFKLNDIALLKVGKHGKLGSVGKTHDFVTNNHCCCSIRILFLLCT